MLVSGIVIIVLLIAGVSVMFLLLETNNESIAAGTVIAIHDNERVKEDVDLVWNGQDLKMHNAGPEINILEYRVVDDDGTILHVCRIPPSEQEVGTSVKEIVNTTAFDECWQEFVTP